MNTKPDDIFEDILRHLRPALIGLLFGVFTLLFGFGLGIVFGLNEGIIKTRLKTSAAEVRDTVYRADDVAIKAVLDKSWDYFQRAHLHAGGLGATAVGLILVVVVLGTGPVLTRLISLGLGGGGLGYSIFWLWAGLRAPALGSTGVAKESLKWIAMPCSGAVIIATLAVAVLVFAAIVPRRLSRASR